MPKTKNYSRKKRTTKLKKLEKKVNKIAGVIETNYKDVSINQAVAYDVNSTVHLSSLTYGGDGGAGTRRGRWASPKFLEIRGVLSVAADANLQPLSYVRMVVIQTKQRFVPQTNAGTDTSSVLTSQGTAITPFQPFEINNRRHFTVKYDKVHNLGFWSSGAAGQNNGTLLKPIHIKIKPTHKMQFEDDSTDIEGGQIYLLMYSNRVSSEVEPTFIGVSRLLYQDA